MLQGTVFQPAQLECLDGYVDEKTMSLAVLNSLKHGVHFKPAEAIAMDCLIDERTMEAIVLDAVKVGTVFKANDIERLSGLVGQDVLDKAALSSKGTYSEEDIEKMIEYLSIEAQMKIAQHSPPKSQKSEEIQVRPSNAALEFLLTKMLSDKPAKTVQRFQVGDAVYVRPYSSFGRIIDINGNMYMVRYSDGKYVSSFPADELEKTT